MVDTKPSSLGNCYLFRPVHPGLAQEQVAELCQPWQPQRLGRNALRQRTKTLAQGRPVLHRRTQQALQGGWTCLDSTTAAAPAT